ncbi:MAG: hypothetical protein DRQ44_03985 [Gammaproteobacteria bacterium]|nr:MAG: hypothetical protein DRQ44_03985 [Gammaproteobacteria bacterium]
MKLKNKILSVVALSTLSQVAYAVPFTFEARSLGMGGVATATADLASAAWANPAMLTNQRPDDDFSLLIGIGAFVRDNDDLLTDIDDFQAADDRLQAAKAAANPQEIIDASTDMLAIIQGIDGKDMAVDVSGLAAMGLAFDSFAMAISIRADAIGAGTVTDLSQNITEVDDVTKNILNIEGVLATEFGVSFAKAFRVANRKLSVGIKPKLVDLQAITFSESIKTIDGLDSLTDQSNKRDLGTFTTVDLGLAYDVTKSFRLGLNIRNLITDEFDLGGTVLNFDTEARLGLAYHNRLLTVAVDYDLRENKPLLANPVFDDLKTQNLAIGAEFNAFDFMQLRVGARKNVASGIPDGAKDTAITAGIGFWLGFNLDIAATFTENSVGGFLQTGFRF